MKDEWQLEFAYPFQSNSWSLPVFQYSRLPVPPMMLEDILKLLEDHKKVRWSVWRKGNNIENLFYMMKEYPECVRIRHITTDEIIPYVGLFA